MHRPMALTLAVAAFAGGVWLLVESAEGLVRTLAAWSAAAGLSGLTVAALVLGLDLESTAAGVAATLDGLPGTALGATVGAAIFLVTIGLGLAAAAFPFRLAVPWPALVAPGLGTALALALLVDGTLSRVDGALLVGAFGPLLLLLARARHGEDQRTAEGHRPNRLALRIGAGLAGVVIGAELLVAGTRGLVDGLGFSETLFGLIVIGAAVSFEEVVLEMLPAYRGHPEISVGNALGTLLFLVTGSLGAIALVRPVPVPDQVREFHGPALAAAVALLGALLVRGRLGRLEGAVMIAAYAAYLGGAVITA